MSTTPDTARLLELFDRLDFEGFNRQDWDVYRSLHTDDVIVVYNGDRIEGIDAHVEQAKQIYQAMPAIEIVEHLVGFGQGEWTCGISRVINAEKPEVTFVTVARWRGERIAEEYIWSA